MSVLGVLCLVIYKTYGLQLDNKLDLSVKIKVDSSIIIGQVLWYIISGCIGIMIFSMNSPYEGDSKLKTIYDSLRWFDYIAIVILSSCFWVMISYKRKLQDLINRKEVIYRNTEFMSFIVTGVSGSAGIFLAFRSLEHGDIINCFAFITLSFAVCMITSSILQNYHKYKNVNECYIYLGQTHRVKAKILSQYGDFLLIETSTNRRYIRVDSIKMIISCKEMD